MEATGRCVYTLFLQLCLFYITSIDPASPKNVADIRDFRAHVVAYSDKCNLKIKLTDPKYSSSLDEPVLISRSSDLESATSTPLDVMPGKDGEKGEKGAEGVFGQRGYPGIQGPRGETGTSGGKGENGLKGNRGDKGDTGERGIQGIQGPRGEAGTNGEKGENGIKGDIGDKGDPGERGIQGIQGPQGEAGTSGEKGENGLKGDRGDKGDIGERGIQGIQGPQGEAGTNGEKGENGIKGDIGDKGDPGERGIQGIQGPQGEAGTNGEKGENGIKGDIGDKGDPGERGIQGIQGPQGETGTSGEKGENGLKGDRGDKGDTGERGIQGAKGDIGPAGKDCPLDDLPIPEETPARIGDASHPAKFCGDLRETGVFTINPIKPFTVFCNIEKSEMCIKSEPLNLLEEIEIENKSKKFVSEPFWINLDFLNTYNVIQSQMSYVLSQSTGVRQKIVYYCRNNEVTPTDKSKSLLLSLWSGQLVGPAPSRETPMKYTVQDDTCSESNNTWKSAIIKMETNFVNLLPILDIYIQDIRIMENQAYHIELIELCFSYEKPARRNH